MSCHGKGRKDRITPLIASTVATLRTWLAERAGSPSDPLFPTQQGRALSRDAVEHRLAKYATLAAHGCPSLRTKRIFPAEFKGLPSEAPENLEAKCAEEGRTTPSRCP